MNKNSKRNRPAINEANKGAVRLSRQAKVARKEQSGEAKGPSLIEQSQTFYWQKPVYK